MLMPIGAALLNEHNLVDAGFLVTCEMLAQLVGSADAAAAGIVGQPVLHLQEALPQLGPARPMLSKKRVIAERIAKKPEPVEPAADCFGFVGVTGHACDDRDVRIDAMADRNAFGRFDDA